MFLGCTQTIFYVLFCCQGNQKEEEELPEKMSIFSEGVPNTNSGNYGSRVNTELGATIGQLEKKFYSKQRRKKMGNDLVCY